MDNDTNARSSCIACLLAAGELPLPGGRIHETEHWLVEHSVGPLGVGTLIVKPKRHVVHVADLTDAEAVELGPLLRDTSRVTTVLTEPEQVYVTLWSHAGGAPGHIHYVIHPITRDVMQRYGHGASVQPQMFAENQTPDADAVSVFAESARRLFDSR